MLEKLMKNWKEVIWIFTVVAVAFTFYSWKVEASDTKKKVDKFEETFKNIEQIAKNLADPNTWLRNYLRTHGEDSIAVKEWIAYAKKVPTDSTGAPRNNIIFYDDKVFPEIGIIKLYILGKETVIDTLWNYIKRK